MASVGAKCSQDTELTQTSESIADVLHGDSNCTVRAQCTPAQKPALQGDNGGCTISTRRFGDGLRRRSKMPQALKMSGNLPWNLCRPSEVFRVHREITDYLEHHQSRNFQHSKASLRPWLSPGSSSLVLRIHCSPHGESAQLSLS